MRVRHNSSIAKFNPPFGPWYSVNLSGYRLVYYKGIFQGLARKDESGAAFYVADESDKIRRAAFWADEDNFQLWVDGAGEEKPEWVTELWLELWGEETPRFLLS